MSSNNQNKEKIERLSQIVQGSNNIVFFGGAGVSTESGVPDFRSVDGLYNQKFKYPPETMLSHSFYVSHKQEFYDFYREKLLIDNIKPNAAHKKLAEWEANGKCKAVITQNIDGLHQAAGSKNVLELHGSTLRNYCEGCHAFYGAEKIKASNGVPKCDKCGSDIKPDVVLYEESLKENVIRNAVNAIANCDVLIVGGTSLVVYPAASMVQYYTGNKLIVVNSSNLKNVQANLFIQGKIGEVFSSVNFKF